MKGGPKRTFRFVEAVNMFFTKLGCNVLFMGHLGELTMVIIKIRFSKVEKCRHWRRH